MRIQAEVTTTPARQHRTELTSRTALSRRPAGSRRPDQHADWLRAVPLVS